MTFKSVVIDKVDKRSLSSGCNVEVGGDGNAPLSPPLNANAPLARPGGMMKILIKSIPIDKIAVGERLRTVRAGHAEGIVASKNTFEYGSAIIVRPTPNAGGGATPYTLVTGAARLEADRLRGRTEIEAQIEKLTATEAVFVEIADNIARVELTTLDRALLVARFAKHWKKLFGEPNRAGGAPRKIKGLTLGEQSEAREILKLLEKLFRLETVRTPLEQMGEILESTLTKLLAERMQVSVRSLLYLRQIGADLDPCLVRAFEVSPVADNQSQLLKCCRIKDDGKKTKPERSKELADAFLKIGDFDAAWAEVFGAEPKGGEENFRRTTDRLVSAFTTLGYADMQRAIVILVDVMAQNAPPVSAPETALKESSDE